MGCRREGGRRDRWDVGGREEGEMGCRREGGR